MWAMGDYPAVATEVIAALGPILVEATGIAPGDRVLDVAAGSGNAAIPAALTGADVVASDLTPDLLETGRQAADAAASQLRWEVGDAEALPYDDAEFDVGHLLRRRHVRPAPPAGRRRAGPRGPRPAAGSALLSWTPAGFIGQMFATMKPYAPPPPPGAQPPPLWGDEAHVREPARRPGHRRRRPRPRTLPVPLFPRRCDVPRLLQAHLRTHHRRLPVPRRRPGAHGGARRGPRGPRRPLRQRRPDGVGVPAAHRPPGLEPGVGGPWPGHLPSDPMTRSRLLGLGLGVLALGPAPSSSPPAAAEDSRPGRHDVHGHRPRLRPRPRALAVRRPGRRQPGAVLEADRRLLLPRHRRSGRAARRRSRC